jgi:hypothetical protein
MYLFRLFFGMLINNSQVLCKPQRRDTVLVVSALGAVDQATSYRTKTISFVVIIFIWFQFWWRDQAHLVQKWCTFNLIRKRETFERFHCWHDFKAFSVEIRFAEIQVLQTKWLQNVKSWFRQIFWELSFSDWLLNWIKCIYQELYSHIFWLLF